METQTLGLRPDRQTAGPSDMNQEPATAWSTVVAAVKLLPGQWTLASSTDSYARAMRADGLTISFTYDRSGRRFECKPCVPSLPNHHCTLVSWGVLPSAMQGPAASFAGNREPAALARELVRKVVEPYEPMYPVIMERRAARLASYERNARLAKKIASAFETEVYGDPVTGEDAKIYASAGEGRLEFKVCGSGSVYLTARSLDGELATKLAEFAAMAIQGLNNKAPGEADAE